MSEKDERRKQGIDKENRELTAALARLLLPSMMDSGEVTGAQFVDLCGKIDACEKTEPIAPVEHVEEADKPVSIKSIIEWHKDECVRLRDLVLKMTPLPARSCATEAHTMYLILETSVWHEDVANLLQVACDLSDVTLDTDSLMFKQAYHKL